MNDRPLRTMVASKDGGYSLNKVIELSAWCTVLGAWIIVGVLIALSVRGWADFQGWFIGGGGLVFTSVLSKIGHRATYNPKAD